MTKYTGNSVAVDFDSTALTCITNVDFPKSAKAIDATCAGLSAMEYKAGKTDAQFTVNGLDDQEGTMQTLLAVGTEATLDYYKSGNSTGMIKESATAIVVNYNQSAAQDGMAAYTVTFQITGSITKSTVA